MKLKLVNGPGKCCICLRQETSNICGNFVNLRTDYFFVDRCCSKIYTMSKCYQKYLQNIILAIILGKMEGNVNEGMGFC